MVAVDEKDCMKFHGDAQIKLCDFGLAEGIQF